jgi:hypothetical protein
MGVLDEQTVGDDSNSYGIVVAQSAKGGWRTFYGRLFKKNFSLGHGETVQFLILSTC